MFIWVIDSKEQMDVVSMAMSNKPKRNFQGERGQGKGSEQFIGF
jgi:hypothetical protein